MSIRPLGSADVKFIASGEKISDIEDAIRELIDNSTDARAKNIEIRMARFGTDSIEVSDDGTGIDESNFDSLGLRYHTSKINDYKHLQDSLETFGFRGEALCCLCNVANVVITTKTKSSPTGTRLTFKSDGTWKKDHIARSEGTTVILKNLFHSLPVRRRELLNTAKRQYDKVVKLIYEQVLARPHIKFTLCKKNTMRKEKDFTHGGSSLTGVIIAIYGVKVMESLMPIKQAGLAKRKCSPVDQSDAEAQPCTSSQSREIVDMTATDISDSVAVSTIAPTVATPKQDIFFTRTSRSGLAHSKPEYLIHGYISKVNEGRNSTDAQFNYINKKPCDIPKLSKLINEIYRKYSSNKYPFYCLFIQVQPWAADFNVPRKRAVILQDEARLCDIVRESLESMYSPYAPARQKSCPTALIPVMTQSDSFQPKGETEVTTQNESLPQGEQPAAKASDDLSKPKDQPETTAQDESLQQGEQPAGTASDDSTKPGDLPETTAFNESSQLADQTATPVQERSPQQEDQPAIMTEKNPSQPRAQPATDYYDNSPQPMDQAEMSEPLFSQTKVDKRVSIDGELQARMNHLEDLGAALRRERSQRTTIEDAKEYSFAIHPKFNTVAEQELRFNINKSSFESMEVIGQFNKGFILARLNKHIFIIDQHATDERANFEEELDKRPFITQTMIHPKPLYLTSIQENAIIDNLRAFAKRGFEFDIDQSKRVGMRVLLKSTAVCKSNEIDEHLTKDDLEELIDVAVNAPNQLESYTLRKVKNIAATRACRRSVMIGDKLSFPQMDEIVKKMSTLDNPWVCAHDRPTIRHLMESDWL